MTRKGPKDGPANAVKVLLVIEERGHPRESLEGGFLEVHVHFQRGLQGFPLRYTPKEGGVSPLFLPVP